MSTDPRIEAAAKVLSVHNGWPSSSFPDGMAERNAKAYREQAAQIVAAIDKAATITDATTRQLIDDLTDDEPCWLDHHGGCQAHGYLSLKPGEKCPQQEAKEWVAAFDSRGTE